MTPFVAPKKPRSKYIYEAGSIDDYNRMPCPKCGCRHLVPQYEIYLPGEQYTAFVCQHPIGRTRECGQVVYVHLRVPELVWVSEDGVWTIYRRPIDDGSTHICVYEDGCTIIEICGIESDGSTWMHFENSLPGDVKEALRAIVEDCGGDASIIGKRKKKVRR